MKKEFNLPALQNFINVMNESKRLGYSFDDFDSFYKECKPYLFILYDIDNKNVSFETYEHYFDILNGKDAIELKITRLKND
jgi:hypothetical protein